MCDVGLFFHEEQYNEARDISQIPFAKKCWAVYLTSPTATEQCRSKPTTSYLTSDSIPAA